MISFGTVFHALDITFVLSLTSKSISLVIAIVHFVKSVAFASPSIRAFASRERA